MSKIEPFHKQLPYQNLLNLLLDKNKNKKTLKEKILRIEREEKKNDKKYGV